MKRMSAVLFIGAGAAVFLGLLAVAGCSGGGPLSTTGTLTPVNQFLQLLPAVQRAATLVGAAKCSACHTDNYTSWTKTKHSQVQVDCESCHGPGSAHVVAQTK